MYVNSTQLQHASLDTAVQVALVMVMVIMKMMRRVVNQCKWCSDAVRRPGSDDGYDYDCDEDDQSSRGSGDFDNYEDDDHDDGDVRLIEQNMTIPSQLDDFQL